MSSQLSLFSIKKWLISGSLLLLFAPPVFSHDQDYENEYEKEHTKRTKPIKILLKSMEKIGGLHRINAIKNQQIISTIVRNEPEQTRTAGDKAIHAATIRRELIKDFAHQRSYINWDITSLYPLVDNFQYEERINKDRGYLLGRYTFFPLPTEISMLSNRVASRLKTNLIGSPLSLSKMAWQQSTQLQWKGVKRIKNRRYFVISMPGIQHPISLYFDTRNYRLRAASTIEDDPIYGDTRVFVRFSKWEEVDQLRLPYKVTTYVNGHKVSIESRELISLNRTFNEELFSIPQDFDIPPDQAMFDWGLRSAHWLDRALALSVPFDLNQHRVEDIQIKTVAEGIHLLLGFTHNSLLIEMSDHLVLIDPSLYEQRTQSILSLLDAKWPNKAVKYVVATHFHFDHIGGIRGYAARGAKVIVGQSGVQHVRSILEARHTFYPDALSKTNITPEIIAVDDANPYVLSDGARNIRLINLPNQHASDMLLPYIEDAKLLFTSDNYNPAGFPIPLPANFSFWGIELLDLLEPLSLDIDLIAGAHGSLTSFAQFKDDIEVTRQSQ